MITLTPFRISAGSYMRLVLSLYLRRWWWVYAAVVAATAALGTIDSNFIILALMIVFIIFPMLLAYLYFYYGLAAESRYSILSKKAELTDEGLRLIFIDEKGEENGAELLKWSQFSGIQPMRNHLLLPFSGMKFRFVAIPYDSLTEESIKAIKRYLSSNK
jgi:hypothetical protein